MIAIILGGILGGVFTPTEASSVAVFYGLFLAFVVYRSLTIRQFLGLFRTTIEISGMVLLVIAMAAMLGYALTIFQVPTGSDGCSIRSRPGRCSSCCSCRSAFISSAPAWTPCRRS